MKSLFYSYNQVVDKAYIIRVDGNANSEAQAARCAQSCENVGQPYEIWDAYNGLDGEIKPPANHHQAMNLVKVTDHYLTRGELACALSHISLWVKCIEQDQPLVILEHDSVMVRPYTHHAVFNSICFLGSNEQANQGWQVLPTPPHASEAQRRDQDLQIPVEVEAALEVTLVEPLTAPQAALVSSLFNTPLPQA